MENCGVPGNTDTPALRPEMQRWGIWKELGDRSEQRGENKTPLKYAAQKYAGNKKKEKEKRKCKLLKIM